MTEATEPGRMPERVQPDRNDKERRQEGDTPAPDKDREQVKSERTQPDGGERQQPR
jgi:hypothetical protein